MIVICYYLLLECLIYIQSCIYKHTYFVTLVSCQWFCVFVSCCTSKYFCCTHLWCFMFYLSQLAYVKHLISDITHIKINSAKMRCAKEYDCRLKSYYFVHLDFSLWYISYLSLHYAVTSYITVYLSYSRRNSVQCVSFWLQFYWDHEALKIVHLVPKSPSKMKVNFCVLFHSEVISN